MKIGLLTYYWDNNVGQYWQALATLRALRAQFPSARVELVHLRHWGKLNDRWLARKDFKQPSALLKSWRYHRSYRVGRKQNFEYSPIECVTNSYEEAENFVRLQGYDLVVVGADVVLKPLPETKVKGAVPIYWLPDSLKVPKALVASSADIERFDCLDIAVREKMIASLSGFQWIGVRDAMTEDLCNALGSAEVPVLRMPDPTFTLPVERSWAAEARRILPSSVHGKKLAVVHFSKKKGVEHIVSSLKRKGFYVVSLDVLLPGADATVRLTPTAWAGMSMIADVVVTMSFHECIFALKHGRPVIAIDTQPNRYDNKTYMSKTRCLLGDFGLQEKCHLNLERDAPIGGRLASVLDSFTAKDFMRFAEMSEEMGIEYRDKLCQLRKVAVMQ